MPASTLKEVAISYELHLALLRNITTIDDLIDIHDIKPTAGQIAAATLGIAAAMTTFTVKQDDKNGKTPRTAAAAEWLLTQTIQPFCCEWSHREVITPKDQLDFVKALGILYRKFRETLEELEDIYTPFHGTELMNKVMRIRAEVDSMTIS